MTSTMRWLTLLPAAPGALLGGWLGEHMGLRASLLFAGFGALGLALFGWRVAAVRELRVLPPTAADDTAAAAASGVPAPGGLAAEGG